MKRTSSDNSLPSATRARVSAGYSFQQKQTLWDKLSLKTKFRLGQGQQRNQFFQELENQGIKPDEISDADLETRCQIFLQALNGSDIRPASPRDVNSVVSPTLPTLSTHFVPLQNREASALLSVNHAAAADHAIPVLELNLSDEEMAQVNAHGTTISSSAQEERIRKFLTAARNNDVAGLKQALEEGADVNAKNELGFTAFHCTVQCEAKEALMFLLSQAGIEVDAGLYADGATPLYFAVSLGHEGLVKMLLQKGANIHAEILMHGGTTSPLECALENGHQNILEMIIAFPGTNPLDFSDLKQKRDESSDRRKLFKNYIALACKSNNRQFIKYVIDQSGLKTFMPKEAQECMELALKLNKFVGLENILIHFLKYYIDDNPWWKLSLEGNNPSHLHWAACSGSLKIFKKYLPENSEEKKTALFLQEKLNKETPFDWAVNYSSLKIIRFILQDPQNHALLHEVNEWGDTLLHVAAHQGHLAIVEWILKTPESLALLRKVNNNGDTPLYLAAEGGHLAIVESILQDPQNHALLDEANYNAKTPLYTAVQRGHLAIVACILKTPESLVLLEKSGLGGYTPLHLAAQSGRLIIVKLILEDPQNHALLHKVDNQGYTPLHHAVQQVHRAIVEYILKTAENHTLLQDLNGQGNNIFHLTCQPSLNNKSKRKILILILQDPQNHYLLTQLNNDGYTPLHLAMLDGQIDIVRCILEDPLHYHLIKLTDSKGLNPLQLAAFKNQTAILQLILESHIGADLLRTCIDKDGGNLLHWAVLNNLQNFIELILATEVGQRLVNMPNYFGYKPLDLKPLQVPANPQSQDSDDESEDSDNDFDDEDQVEEFDDNQAQALPPQIPPQNPDDGGQYGDMPLHSAALRGDLATVELILQDPQNHALLQQSNRQGNTPLHCAVLEGHLGIVECILKNSLFDKLIKLENTEELNPVQLAIIQDKPEVLSLIFASQVGVDLLNTWRDNNGNNLLHWAYLNNSQDIINLILKIKVGEQLALTPNNDGKIPSNLEPIVETSSSDSDDDSDEEDQTEGFDNQAQTVPLQTPPQNPGDGGMDVG